MALTTTSSVYTYTANGSQRVFTFPYKFTRRTDIRVTLIEDGVETDLVLGAGYNVDPDGGDSATVTLTTAPAAGVLVRIRRVVGLTQPQTFPIQGPFDPKAVEAALDRIHMALQQISEGLGTYVHGKEGGGDLHTLATETEAGFLGPEDYAWMRGHQSSGASHTIEQIEGLAEELERLTIEVGGRAPVVHEHPISAVTGLRPELDLLAIEISQRAPATHSHPWTQVTEKPELYTREEVDGLFETLTPADIGAVPIEEIERIDKRIDDLVVPHIGTNKNWWIAGVDTGIRAEGVDGITPHIGENKNWWIGTTDTGVRAEGVDGSKWFASGSVPSGSLGVVGDFHLHTGDGSIREKTGPSTWTLRGNIRGPEGPAGSRWYTGSGAPSTGLGIVGDFYLDSTTGNFYEKTGTSTWTLRGNIRGPAGADGPAGISPHIGGNGNWWIGDTDTGVPAQGPKGDPGPSYISTAFYTLYGGAGYEMVHGDPDFDPIIPDQGGLMVLKWYTARSNVVPIIQATGPGIEFGLPVFPVLASVDEEGLEFEFMNTAGNMDYPEGFNIFLYGENVP